MSDLLNATLDRASESPVVFAKFLSPNDTGLTGGHQCGIYIPKSCVPLIFDKQFERGENHKRSATIVWNDEITTESSFTYYGIGTRNEYRITRFGRGFDLLKPDHTGDLVVICKQSAELYYAYVLSTDEEIESFLDAYSLSPIELNRLIRNEESLEPLDEDELFDSFVCKFDGEFPSTFTMAMTAQEAYRRLHDDELDISPDELIVRWTETEYRLFRHIEAVHYEWVTLEPAKSLDSFVQTGLEITNRRKSRAGKSLEHHLASIFEMHKLSFSAQAVTEENKKPDFIFPSEEAYHDPNFPTEKLIFLGAKTTCKDRWRQVLKEADRLPHKYLFTLQQGVSPNQLKLMQSEKLTLVVPKQYHHTFPPDAGVAVISLEDFITMVEKTQT